MTEAAELVRKEQGKRAVREARAARVKTIQTCIARFLSSPGSLLTPPDMRGALGELALLLDDLAQVAHEQFDYGAFDLQQLTHRVDALDGLTGEGGVPALVKRVAALERKVNGNG